MGSVEQAPLRLFLSRLTGRGSLAVLGALVSLFVATGPSPAAEVGPPTLPPPPTLPQSGSGPRAAPMAQAGGQAMVGTFELAAGSCAEGVKGSYFRMIQPGGSASGPYVSNNDSRCTDKTYTVLAPGRDRGLTTGAYQPQPDPAFDNTGGGRAERITKPERFYGVAFSTATNPTDPQTDAKVSAPSVSRDSGGRLSGDLRAFAASWNNQHFNQGSPKPDGSRPGNTAGPTGTYNASTGAFTLEWTSQIVGGPFNNFTGQWHLEGRFVSSSATASGSAGASGPAGQASPSVVSPSDATRAPGGSAAGVTAATGPSFPASLGVLAALAGLAGILAVRRLEVGRG